MNVRVTRPSIGGRTLLLTDVTRITCDGRTVPGSGAHRWLQVDDTTFRDPFWLGIGGRHGAIELALDEDGAWP